MKTLLKPRNDARTIPPWEDQAVSTYWITHFTTDRGTCSLCAGTGRIDTRLARSHAGLYHGRLNWCICPNGQAQRHASKGRLPR